MKQGLWYAIIVIVGIVGFLMLLILNRARLEDFLAVLAAVAGLLVGDIGGQTVQARQSDLAPNAVQLIALALLVVLFVTAGLFPVPAEALIFVTTAVVSFATRLAMKKSKP